MDPLSVAGGTAGIVTAALQSIQYLTTVVDNLKDAPSLVKDISADLRAVQPILQDLDRTISQNPSQLLQLNSQIKQAVDNCDGACKAFQSQMQHWTRHSTEEKLFWGDRWTITLFGKDKTKVFRDQLSDCKSTLRVVLDASTVIATSRQGGLTHEIKNTLLQQSESLLENEKTRIEQRIETVERELQQHRQSTTGSGHADERSRQELIRELERQQVANKVLKEVSKEGLNQTQVERSKQTIKNIKVSNNSAALTGFINASEEEYRVDQDISDITADNWSIAVTGVAKGFDFGTLRQAKPGSDSDSTSTELRMT